MRKYVCIILLALSTCAWTEGVLQEHHRGFILEVGGGGFPYLTYGSDADSVLSNYRSTQGLDRVQIWINLDLGWAVSDTTYLVAGVEGFGDGFFAGSSDLDQLDSILYSVGLRYYPFVTGLVVGADLGVSRLAVTTNASTVGSTSWAPGIGAELAWDFGRTPTGTTIEIGVRGIYLLVSDPVITNMFGITPFIDLEIK